MRTLRCVLSSDEGQGLAEYGIILGLIAILSMAALVILGQHIRGNIQSVGSSI